MGVYTEQLAKRLNRQAERSNTWDYINNLSFKVKGHITNIASGILEARDMLIQSNRFNGEAVVIVDNVLKAIEAASVTWRQTAERHAGKRGLPKGPDELNEVLITGQDYLSAHENLMLDTQRLVPRLQEIIIAVEYENKGIALVDPTQDPTTQPPLANFQLSNEV